MTPKELTDLIDNARQEHKLYNNTVWRHWKGGLYEITGLALGSGEGTPVLVLYRRIGDDPRQPEHVTWARPLDEWIGMAIDRSAGLACPSSTYRDTFPVCKCSDGKQTRSTRRAAVPR